MRGRTAIAVHVGHEDSAVVVIVVVVVVVVGQVVGRVKEGRSDSHGGGDGGSGGRIRTRGVGGISGRDRG